MIHRGLWLRLSVNDGSAHDACCVVSDGGSLMVTLFSRPQKLSDTCDSAIQSEICSGTAALGALLQLHLVSA